MLILSNFYSLMASNLFIIYTLFPIIGPTINIGIMYWTIFEMERLKINMRATIDSYK